MTSFPVFSLETNMSLNYRSLNQITLVGRIGQDAALKQTQSGASFATFSVATQTLLKKQDGRGITRRPGTPVSCGANVRKRSLRISRRARRL